MLFYFIIHIKYRMNLIDPSESSGQSENPNFDPRLSTANSLRKESEKNIIHALWEQKALSPIDVQKILDSEDFKKLPEHIQFKTTQHLNALVDAFHTSKVLEELETWKNNFTKEKSEALHARMKEETQAVQDLLNDHTRVIESHIQRASEALQNGNFTKAFEESNSARNIAYPFTRWPRKTFYELFSKLWLSKLGRWQKEDPANQKFKALMHSNANQVLTSSSVYNSLFEKADIIRTEANKRMKIQNKEEAKDIVYNANSYNDFEYQQIKEKDELSDLLNQEPENIQEVPTSNEKNTFVDDHASADHEEEIKPNNEINATRAEDDTVVQSSEITSDTHQVSPQLIDNDISNNSVVEEESKQQVDANSSSPNNTTVQPELKPVITNKEEKTESATPEKQDIPKPVVEKTPESIEPKPASKPIDTDIPKPVSQNPSKIDEKKPEPEIEKKSTAVSEKSKKVPFRERVGNWRKKQKERFFPSKKKEENQNPDKPQENNDKKLDNSDKSKESPDKKKEENDKKETEKKSQDKKEELKSEQKIEEKKSNSTPKKESNFTYNPLSIGWHLIKSWAVWIVAVPTRAVAKAAHIVARPQSLFSWEMRSDLAKNVWRGIGNFGRTFTGAIYKPHRTPLQYENVFKEYGEWRWPSSTKNPAKLFLWWAGKCVWIVPFIGIVPAPKFIANAVQAGCHFIADTATGKFDYTQTLHALKRAVQLDYKEWKATKK